MENTNYENVMETVAKSDNKIIGKVLIFTAGAAAAIFGVKKTVDVVSGKIKAKKDKKSEVEETTTEEVETEE